MNSFSKIVAFILVAIIMFLGPLLYMAQKQDSINQSYISNETTRFVDSIKNTGLMSREMYMDFIRKIDHTNNLYKIEIIHSHKVVEPEYDENAGVFLNDYFTYYTNTYQDEIVSAFDQGEDYNFSQGDYISITVVNRTRTLATKLMELFYRADIPEKQILVTYGGRIRDEVN
ncbi:MAG: hypothetical protein WCD89_23420 [Anaerocolumna sp.]